MHERLKSMDIRCLWRKFHCLQLFVWRYNQDIRKRWLAGYWRCQAFSLRSEAHEVLIPFGYRPLLHGMIYSRAYSYHAL